MLRVIIKENTKMAGDRHDLRKSSEECSRWTEGSRKVMPKKEKKKLEEHLNVIDCNKSFSVLSETFKI